MTFNQRSVAEMQMIQMLGLVGRQAEATALADRLSADLDRIRESAARFPRRHRTFFEEWDNPLISGIRWVEELVEIAGGTNLSELVNARLGRERIDPTEVARRDPEIIFASWCGKKSTLTESADARVGQRQRGPASNFRVKSTTSCGGPSGLSDGVKTTPCAVAQLRESA
jgi:iron complex transport system substrate-binding protein